MTGKAFNLRLHDDVRVALETAAKSGGRFLNAEIERRLERSLHDDDIVGRIKASFAP